MSRCIKIVIKADKWKKNWDKDIQKKAKKFEVEGSLQSIGDEKFKIIACCKDDKLDDFVDYLYDLLDSIDAVVEDLEPFIKKQDYRGIFRVI
jgi:acylphosphatase